jgi:tryptophan synthase alpha chain
MSVHIEPYFCEKRAAGAPLLAVYVTAGLPGWTDVVRAVVDGGADCVEIGIPFSDPIMDGPVIQQASTEALKNGATMHSILRDVATLDVDRPLVVMTYYNLIAHRGHERCARELVDAGVSGAILPDLQFDELDDWAQAADDAALATVLLVAPTTPDDRFARIAQRSRGFLYCVSLLGVTGERDSLETSAREIAARARAVSPVPALLGVGISTPDQAAAAAQISDGVVVGSALMRRVLDGEGAEGARRFTAELRGALDGTRP